MNKIHIGCGKRDFGSDWIHIDGGDYSHLDSSDIINLPVDDNSINLIYASHVLEYFDRVEAKEILEKWYTKLAPGGKLRLAVPNFKAMVTLYFQGTSLDNFLGPLFGKMEMDNQTIYHKTVYDFDSLKQILVPIGFNDFRKYDWQKTEHAQFDDHSQAYLPHMDKENGTLISLNIEAVK